MAKVETQLIPSGMEKSYSRSLMWGGRYYNARVRMKNTFLSRLQKEALRARSLPRALSPVWRALSSGDKISWNSAALISNLDGYALFVKDKALRIKNSISGYSTPSDVYQANIGKIDFSGGAVNSVVRQDHPINYYAERKILGTQSQYEQIYVTENLTDPAVFGLSYKTSFTASGGSPICRLQLMVYSHSGISVFQTPFNINLTSGAGWQDVTMNMGSVPGTIDYYELKFILQDVTGILYFDNLIMEHSGHNWARDPFCDSVDKVLSSFGTTVIPNWEWVSQDAGVILSTVYNYESL